MRLNRHLSQCGVGSRRGCEQLILEGRVSINGHVVKELATQVADGDSVVVDGKPVQRADGIVVAFHKPKGFICSRGDTHDRATIYAILPPQYQTLHYVGRLDKESEGLLLLTNRGELSQRLTHPSEGVEKEYEVTIDSDFAPEHKLKLLHGMLTEEGFAKAERVWVDSARRINVVLKQGLKRQIRLMFYQLGYEVERLVRVRIGGLYLKGMTKGAWKELTDSEIQRYFIKHKERERAVRPTKAGKTAAGEDSDNISSEAVAPAFKLRPGPKSRTGAVRKKARSKSDTDDSTERKPRKSARSEFLGDSDEAAAPSYDSDMPGKPARRGERTDRKPRRGPSGSSRPSSSRPDRSFRPTGRKADTDEAPAPRYDSDRPRKARGGDKEHGAERKPRRGASADKEHRAERKPRRSAGGSGSTTRSFGPAAPAENDAPRYTRTPSRQETRKRFGERSKAGGKPSFSKKSAKSGFKAGNKSPRKGGKK